MKEKPILFNTEMVRAILDGRKTVTRRVVRGEAQKVASDYVRRYSEDLDTSELIVHWWVDTPLEHYVPYRPGDILYVRETWSTRKSNECYAQPCHTGICPHKSCELADGSCFPYEYIYKATDNLPAYSGKWHPSIHMPREAARIFLRVTDVRVERLQEMRAEDSLREGVKLHLKGFLNGEDLLKPFADLWDSTIKPADRDRYGWAANPWVWVIAFERCDKPEEA